MGNKIDTNPAPKKGSAFLFDIDGTCCDTSHREHLLAPGSNGKIDWDAFFDACDRDAPVEHMRLLTQIVADTNRFSVVYVTGRPERVRDQTFGWLVVHNYAIGDMFMRKDGDHRPDHIIKAELLVAVKQAGYQPVMVFDDRDTVVAMWRAMGLPCAQVAEGAF